MTEQNLNLVVEGKNRELRLVDWQYGARIEVLTQSRKRQFISPFRGALEDCYYCDSLSTGKYHWRTGIPGKYLARTALRLIRNPSKNLQKISHWDDNNYFLSERMTPREKPKWANAIYIELPPKPIMVSKGWLVWDFSYSFMKIEELKN